MNIKEKVILNCIVIVLVAINIWSIHSIVQAYKPQTEVKGVQAKDLLIIPTSTISLTPTPKPNKYAPVTHLITPTITPSPTTDNTPNITNAPSQTHSTDTTPASPSSNDVNINANSALTDQLSPSPTPTTQQQATSIPTPTTQPTTIQNTNTVIQGNNPGVSNDATVIYHPPVTPVAVGVTVETHFCPVGQTCQ